ncbi:MAG: PqiC family protein [Gammaproteobacteria bacterium]
MKNIHLLTVIYLLFISACSTSPAAHFYMLTSMPADTASSTNTLADKYIIVGPVNFPKYLDRPHIVTRSETSETYLSDLHRWAEPLQENFTRVLAENLSALLGTEKIGIAPSRNRTLADYRVTLEVHRFDAGRHGEVMLVAYWNIFAGDESTPLSTRKSELKLPTSRNPGYTEMANTLSSAVAHLSREIADTMSGY